MATTKVSSLTALTSPDGAEELLINDGGTSKKITQANLLLGIDNTSADATAITIDSSENVGIGVTPPTDIISGYSSLSLGGNATIHTNTATGAGNSLYINTNAYRDTDPNWRRINDLGAASQYRQHAGTHIFNYVASGSGDIDPWIEAMRIDATGNVGIGDTDPSEAKLSIDNVLTGDSGLKVVRNLDEAGSNPLVYIVDDHANNTQPALKIQQDGAGYGLHIDQNGNNIGMLIGSASTTANVLYVSADAVTTGAGIIVYTASTALASTTTGGLVEIISAGDTDTNDNNLLYIHNDHADSTGTTGLYVKQDSTGAAARFDGKVGIGKTPSTLFDCYGTGNQNATFSSTGLCLVKCITSQEASSSYQIGFHMEDASDNQWGMKLMDSSGDLWFIDNSAGHSGRRPLVLTKADGNVKIDGNLVITTAGKGIMFHPHDETAPTPPAVGSASNLLDDYEEGTFDLGVQDGTLGSGSKGRYTKIGNQVTVFFQVDTGSDWTTDSNIYLTGLPFTPISPNNTGHAGNGAVSYPIAMGTDVISMSAITGGTTMIFSKSDGSYLKHLDCTATWSARSTITYNTA